MQKNAIRPLPLTLYKINSKWAEDLTVKTWISENAKGKTLQEIGVGEDSL